MDNSQMKAGPAEKKKAMVAALLHERVGYERRLIAVDGIEDDEQRERARADAQRRIDEVNAQLGFYGYEGAAPAKRAEKRPVSARAETR